MLAVNALKVVPVVGLMALAAVARGDIAFDNFVAGQYDHVSGYTVDSSQDSACGFVSAVTGQLSSVKIAFGLEFQQTQPGPFNLDLRIDNGGLGTLLKTWQFTPTIWYYNGAIIQLDNSDPVLLTQGQAYWLVASPVNGSQGAWNMALDGPYRYGNFAYSQDGGNNWSYFSGDELAAFRVETTPIPEPAGWAVLVIGLAGLAIRRRMV